MLKNPLLDNIKAGKTSLGTAVNDPDTLELCAHLGFDWVFIDQMFTSNDWTKTEMLIRTAEAAGITPVIRAHSFPWLGYDKRIAVDVSRLRGIGAEYILISNSGKQEIEDCLEVSKDWHRKTITIHPFKDFNEWGPVGDQLEHNTFIIPQPETKQGLHELEETMKLPGVKIVFIAMTDASRVLTNSQTPDWYHPALWEYVDRAVELGKRYGVTVGANTSYAYNFGEMKKRIQRLHDRGVRMILTQTAYFYFQIAMTEFLKDVRPGIGRDPSL
jgi:4-hydroxy-2-oxoheptanedioate aldolase